MKVWYIKYEWLSGKKLCVFNKRGNTLEFPDKEHAEYFLKLHPEAVTGPYEILSKDVYDEDQLEYGRPANIWEGEQKKDAVITT